jgi:hypothetical protein
MISSSDLELSRTEKDEDEGIGGRAEVLPPVSANSQFRKETIHFESSKFLAPSSASTPSSSRPHQETTNVPSRHILSAPSSATSRYGLSPQGVETSPTIPEANRYLCSFLQYLLILQ